MKPIQSAYLQIHIAVFLFGFTAILGKLISLTELSLVWWRMLITVLSFLFFPKLWKSFIALPNRMRWKLLGIGVVVAVHWVCFFGGIKYSNVSICLVCMATASFMTAIFEPIFFRTKIKWYEIGLSSLVIPGMYLVVASTRWDMRLGIVLSLISAFLAVVFSVLNRSILQDNKEENKIDTKVMTFTELGGGWLFLTLLMPFYIFFSGEAFMPMQTDWLYLLVLALLCTTLAFVLNLNALKHITAFSANLAINLEPVYGILLAWLLFQENKEVGDNFYLGVLIVLFAVFSYPIIKRWIEKKASVAPIIDN